jgi:uncharacterized LabA/DUF88 family protein
MPKLFIEQNFTADDFHRGRWMMFVDGENFAIRGQRVAKAEKLEFEEGDFFRRDAFLWLPNVKARACIAHGTDALPLQSTSIRSYYYTSTTGADDVIRKVRSDLRALDFDAHVFKRPTDTSRKSKGVDISLTTDMLSNAFMNNYDAALLIAGDADYIPLVEQVKRLGKVVYGGFFEHAEAGLSEELRLATDTFYNFWPFMRDQWVRHREQRAKESPQHSKS